MRADRGLYDTRTQILEGFGNVVVTTLDGKKLTSPHLKFNQLSNEVSSDTTFQMVAGSRTQSGMGFKTDPNLSRFTCQRSCRTTGTVVLPSNDWQLGHSRNPRSLRDGRPPRRRKDP